MAGLGVGRPQSPIVQKIARNIARRNRLFANQRFGATLLFRLLTRLYERTCLVITTHLSLGEWPPSSATPR
ncbi:hypothetical protein SAMN02746095_02927 [Acidocella aminolytica 101 = DSM 11237]|nr:hypothetical protein SAMN02746095_02927 [Acidocella aminolytica 101 = DSM 11237]